MRNRMIIAGVIAILLTLSSSTVFAKPSDRADKSTQRVPLVSVEAEGESFVTVTVPVSQPSAPGEVTATGTSYPVECTLSLKVSETVNIMGEPGILGRVTVVSCTQAGVTMSGTLAVEHQDLSTGAWAAPSQGSAQRAVGVGGTAEHFYRHNSKTDLGYWRTHFYGTASCLNCQLTPFNVATPSSYQWSGVFFLDWSAFKVSHYDKHKNEWSPVPSMMDYLNKARTAATRAESIDEGSVYDPTWYVGTRLDTNGTTLIGMNTNNGEIVFLHAYGDTYPYLGSFFKHNPTVSGCKTHKDYFYKVTYQIPCP